MYNDIKRQESFQINRKNLPLRLVLLIILSSILEIGGTHVLRYYIGKRILDPETVNIINNGIWIFSVFILIFAFVLVLLCMNISDEMINRDALTQVANGDKIIAFGVRKQMMGTLSNYTGIFINIKDYKYVNDLVGSSIGHYIMREYAQSLMKYLGRKNFIGRLGGDNFMVFVLHDRVDDFLKYISPIEISVNTQEGRKDIKLYARCGIYKATPKDGVAYIMNATSTALNYAKKNGTVDYVWFEESMLEELLVQKSILNSYQAALEEEEFIATFQPKVDLKTEKLCGCEALVCWNHEGKRLPPDYFVPVLEQAGRIVHLDYYIFREVCKALSEWSKEGLPLVKISSNFSRFHLKNPHFSQNVLSIVKEYQVDPKYLEIEITESSEYENRQALDEFVEKMHANGISVSIDDFGTGHSSLSLLHNLDADVVKLDKSFLENLNNKKDRDFIENIVHMIKDLNKTVICEGVELKEQADFLREIHCDMAQGFYYDKALSKEVFRERLTKLI